MFESEQIKNRRKGEYKLVYLTKNEFTKQVEALTNNLTKDELQNLIIEVGDVLFSKNRDSFVQQIQLSLKVKETNQKETEFNQDYFKEFLEFIKELKSYSKNIYDQEPEYDYDYGYSYYDDEETYNFDEDMADRIREYSEDASKLFKTNHKEECRKILSELLTVLNLFDDTPLDIDIDTELLSMPRIEAYSLCLNSIFFTSEKEQRANELLNGFHLFSSEISEDFNVKTVMNCDAPVLPEWDEFIIDWIKILQIKKEHWTNYLLMESLASFRELKDQMDIVLQIGSTNHEFIQLTLEYLLQKEAYTELETVINYAFDVLPAGNERSLTGKILVELGKLRKNEDWVIRGATECFTSRPALQTYEIFISYHMNYQKVKEAKELLQEMAKDWKKNLEKEKNDQQYASYKQNDYILQALLFLEEFDFLIKYCDGFGQLEWEYGYNPKRIVISDMIALLIKNWDTLPYTKQFLTSFLKNENLEILKGTLNYFAETKVKEKINKEKYYSWVKNNIETRIDAILGEKDRKNYWKAALLLKALKELQTEMENEWKAKETEEIFLKKYSKLRAFQSEYKNQTHEKSFSYY